MNGEKIARILAGVAVLAVAVVAGIVSFSHIETLGLEHGYATGTARLLPVSVDGLIIAASLALLTGARAQREAPRLARAGLVLGIVATLAANVEAGARFGLVGALVNAWPGVAFVIASEILLGMLRAAPDVPGAEAVPVTLSPEVPVPLPSTPGTAAAVPVLAGVPASGPVDVTAGTVPTVPAGTARTVAAGRAPRRAPTARSKSPDRLFAAEIERGEVPSIRAIKARAKCGTPRAQQIRDQLAEVLKVQPEAV